MTTTLTQGPDRVLLLETAFSAGFMRDPVDASGRKVRTNFGPSLKAFGHPGAGGSHAFADPENRISFAYVMNQMEPGVLARPEVVALDRRALRCARRRETMKTAADLERFLHEKIPLTVAMGVHVAECSDARLVLTAPLAPNRNHLQTAFGGSLHALATLSGYSLLWWLLREPEAHIVIRESTIALRAPGARRHCVRFAPAPSPAELERFRRDFARKGKARIALEAAIEYDGEVAARFRATFVAMK